jgi:hypothetical protein
MASIHPSGSKPESSSETLSPLMAEEGRKPESTIAAEQNTTLIYELRPTDVLLGRGSRTDKYPGNIAFREVVSRCKRDYRTTVDPEAKSTIAEYIIGQVEKNHGRFLRRIEPYSNEAVALGIAGNESKSKSVWVMIDKYAAIEKTKQALREQGNAKRGKKLTTQHTSRSAKDRISIDGSGGHAGVQRTAQYPLGTSLVNSLRQVPPPRPALLSSFRPLSDKNAALPLPMEFSRDATAPVWPASHYVQGPASTFVDTELSARQQMQHYSGSMAAASFSSLAELSIRQLMQTQHLRLQLQRQQEVVLSRQQSQRHHLQHPSSTYMSNHHARLWSGGGSSASLSPTEAALFQLLRQKRSLWDHHAGQMP